MYHRKVFKFITLVVVAAHCLASNEVEARISKCGAQRDAGMDKCAAAMGFLGDDNFYVPKNLNSMSTFCNGLKESINCLQAYSKDCLQSFTKQILTSLLRRGKQQYSSICGSDDSRKNFMSRMSCLKDDKIASFHQTMHASVARFEHISSSVESDNKLPSLCCSYQIFQRDLDSVLNKICGKPKTRQGSPNEFISKIVSGTTGEFLSLICDGHRSYEECRASKKTSQSLGKLEEVTSMVKESKLKPKNKSLIPPLLEILDDSGPTSGARSSDDRRQSD